MCLSFLCSHSKRQDGPKISIKMSNFHRMDGCTSDSQRLHLSIWDLRSLFFIFQWLFWLMDPCLLDGLLMLPFMAECAPNTFYFQGNPTPLERGWFILKKGATRQVILWGKRNKIFFPGSRRSQSHQTQWVYRESHKGTYPALLCSWAPRTVG